MIKAERLRAGTCAGKYDWYFRFVSFEKAKSGYVRYSPVGVGCELKDS